MRYIDSIANFEHANINRFTVNQLFKRLGVRADKHQVDSVIEWFALQFVDEGEDDGRARYHPQP